MSTGQPSSFEHITCHLTFCGPIAILIALVVRRKALNWARIGEKIVKAIRFPVMKQQEFASLVPDAKILTPDEVINIFKFFNSAAAATGGFLNRKRSSLGKPYIPRKPNHKTS